MNKERLLKLAAFLRTVPLERFNMSTWADDEFDNDGCGTAACALGWATRIPEFRDLGLHLERHPGAFVSVSFDRWSDVNAAQKFFGIDWDEADGIFIQESYSDCDEFVVPPSMVADHIEYVVSRASSIDV